MTRIFLVFLLSILSTHARASDMPFLGYIEDTFPEIESVMSEYFDLFETEQYIYALKFGSNNRLTIMMENGGAEIKYPGKHTKKYLDYRKRIIQFPRIDVYREVDRTSITVSTAGKFGAFIEAQLNRYYKAPEPKSCENADFNAEDYCLVHLKGRWYITYFWFPRQAQ